MSLKPTITNTIRKLSKKAFVSLAKGRGVANVNFYPTYEGVELIDRNVYHDVTQDDTLTATAVPTECFIEFNVPLKVVKSLGWWKEDETMPIIMYLPWQADFTPTKGAKVVVPPQEGYMEDTWEILHVKQYGQGIPLLWVCNVRGNKRP